MCKKAITRHAEKLAAVDRESCARLGAAASGYAFRYDRRRYVDDDARANMRVHVDPRVYEQRLPFAIFVRDIGMVSDG